MKKTRPFVESPAALTHHVGEVRLEVEDLRDRVTRLEREVFPQPVEREPLPSWSYAAAALLLVWLVILLLEGGQRA